MGGKGGVKEKFSICRFRLKKVKKVGNLRNGDKKICDAGARHRPNQESGCAAALPRRGQASLIYRSLIYLGREPVIRQRKNN